jgi:hypothetical protein
MVEFSTAICPIAGSIEDGAAAPSGPMFHPFDPVPGVPPLIKKPAWIKVLAMPLRISRPWMLLVTEILTPCRP